ncbi:hypothetical protein [Gorillibacterium timonense]|uniref:hypothetical protein n=1 Tax=Gorillibacterium timonense TaxID=1689269 RepID=UPI00131BAC0B|nr:hypothetical protein [Gorillibacterium timonense]
MRKRLLSFLFAGILSLTVAIPALAAPGSVAPQSSHGDGYGTTSVVVVNSHGDGY